MNLRDAAQQAAPREQLLKELMDSRVPKTEREHAAVREIERLHAALADTQDWDELEALRASLREHMAEIKRLNECLTWEQHRAEHVGTHGPGCAMWGPKHYECLLRAHKALKERTVREDRTVWATSQESRQVEPVAWLQISGAIMTPREIALSICEPWFNGDPCDKCECHKVCTKLVERIETAIRAERVPETNFGTISQLVAYISGYHKGRCIIEAVDPNVLLPVGMALYRLPPKREPLTDEMLWRMWVDSPSDVLRFARAVERAHGIGGEE